MNHTVTGKAPADLFAEERGHLLDLPRNIATGEYTGYGGYQGELRKVSKDCLVSFIGNRYSVPHLYACQDVWIKVSKGAYVTIASNAGKTIATHALAPGRGQVILNREHYRGHIHGRDRESFFISSEKMRERFAGYEGIHKFIGSVKSQGSINPVYHLFVINRMFEDYPDEDCLRCMEECMKYRCFTFAFIKGYLAHRCRIKTSFEPAARPLHEISILYGANVKRSLKEYQI